MKKFMKKALNKSNEGFSLVELIIVIAIMAILIGIIALNVLPYMEKSRESKDRQTLDSVYSAFTTALADKPVSADFTGTTDASLNANIKKAVETNLGISLADAKAKLVSQNCTGKDFYFTKAGTEVSVAIGSAAGVQGKYQEEHFISSNIKTGAVTASPTP